MTENVSRDLGDKDFSEQTQSLNQPSNQLNQQLTTQNIQFRYYSVNTHWFALIFAYADQDFECIKILNT